MIINTIWVLTVTILRSEWLTLGFPFVAQLVKNPPVMQETIPGLGRSPGEGNSYPLTTTLAWRIPWTVQPMGSERVGHDWATFTFFMVHSPSQAHAARKMGVKIWTNAVHSRKYTHIEKLKRTPPPHISLFTNLTDTYMFHHWTNALHEEEIK